MMCIIEVNSILLAAYTQNFSLCYAFFAPIFALIYVLVVLGFLALFLRFLPKFFFSPKRIRFRVSKFEEIFYQKIKIRKWKDFVPEMGWTAGFPKNKITSLETTYLKRFLWETCFAESLHFLSASLGFTALIIFPKEAWFFCCANPLHKCGLKCSSLLGSKAHSGQTSKGDKSQTKRRSALS